MSIFNLRVVPRLEYTKNKSTGLVVGIDAANIRGGGGVTHLTELLQAAEPSEYGIRKVIVWGGQKTLQALEDRLWLEKVCPDALNGNSIQRALWQWRELSNRAKQSSCDILFVPGGNFLGSFRPFVTMSQNLLPFEPKEAARFRGSLVLFRLRLLKWLQSLSFRRADGVIFLTTYARDCVLGVVGSIQGKTSVIPHGINARFRAAPKLQYPIEEYTEQNPYRVLYVSIVDQYKHQWHVVEAVASLRREGMPLVLDLIGPSYHPALIRLNNAINRFDPSRSWVFYHESVPYEELEQKYKSADLAVFASSCENLPIILLEMMASGLPVASSNRGPMPQILEDGGVYFDPESPSSVEKALKKLITSPRLRSEMAQRSTEKTKDYSWVISASDTFGFLTKIHEKSSEA